MIRKKINMSVNVYLFSPGGSPSVFSGKPKPTVK
jgi:hypothetical protein